MVIFRLMIFNLFGAGLFCHGGFQFIHFLLQILNHLLLLLHGFYQYSGQFGIVYPLVSRFGSADQFRDDLLQVRFFWASLRNGRQDVLHRLSHDLLAVGSGQRIDNVLAAGPE